MEREGFADNRYRNYRFTRESVAANAPQASGVYGLYNALWIYVGETENIQAELLGHLVGDSKESCGRRHHATGFAFEIVPETDRHRRLLELLRELQPLAQRDDSRSQGADETSNFPRR